MPPGPTPSTSSVCVPRTTCTSPTSSGSGRSSPARTCPRSSRPSVDSTAGAIELVLIGPKGWNEDLERHLGSADGRVRQLGFVPEADKRALYAGAEVFCLPSLREGFGLPVLEAMAQGAPVITSTGTATAEVAGDAGVLVDPLDATALADAMAGVLDAPDRAAPMRDGVAPPSRRAPVEPYRRAARRGVPRGGRVSGSATRGQPPLAGAGRGRWQRGLHRAAAGVLRPRSARATPISPCSSTGRSCVAHPGLVAAYPDRGGAGGGRAQEPAGRRRSDLVGPAAPARTTSISCTTWAATCCDRPRRGSSPSTTSSRSPTRATSAGSSGATSVRRCHAPCAGRCWWSP